MKNNKSKFSRTISAAMAAVTVAASLTGVSSFALTPGDINNDGTVDVRDVVRLMRSLRASMWSMITQRATLTVMAR